MPMADSLDKSLSWSTLSKAFEKSRRTASVCPLLLRELLKSRTVVMSCVSQLRFCLNPCWKLFSMENSSKWSIMLLWIMCSRVFEVIDVKEMGL